MKMTLSLLFLVLLVNTGTGAQSKNSAEQTPPPFSITIRALQDVVKTGSEVLVEVTLKNTSTQEIGFVVSGTIAYLVDVRDVQGTMVPNTERGRKLRERQENRGDQVTIGVGGAVMQPGETFKTKMNVNDLYDVARPGKYFIRVSREILPI